MIFQRSQFSLYIIHSYIQKKCQDSSSHLGESLHTYQSIIASDHELKMGIRIEQISRNWSNRSVHKEIYFKIIANCLEIFRHCAQCQFSPKSRQHWSYIWFEAHRNFQNNLQIKTQISFEIPTHLEKNSWTIFIRKLFEIVLVWSKDFCLICQIFWDCLDSRTLQSADLKGRGRPILNYHLF